MNENEELEPFYHRIFGKKTGTIWETEIHEFLHANDIKLEVVGVIDEEDSENMDIEAEELIFIDNKDREIAALVRNKSEKHSKGVTEAEELHFVDDQVGQTAPLDRDDRDLLDEEIAEFRDMVDEFYPETNRKWFLDFLDDVQYCYAFALNTENITDDNWESIAQLCDWLRDEIDGIELSDGGMITNQDGDVILVIPDDDDDSEKEEWYPIQVALRDGETWQSGEVETAEDAAAFISGKILE